MIADITHNPYLGILLGITVMLAVFVVAFFVITRP